PSTHCPSAPSPPRPCPPRRSSDLPPGARTRGVQVRSLHNADPLRHGRKAGVPRFFAALALTAAALSLAPAPAEAQYFGRNKVQYEQFDWQIFDTPHFNVYHYPAESLATLDMARSAERWYERLSGIMQFTFQKR